MVRPCADGRHWWREESDYMGQRKYICRICGMTGSGY
jgi:hypothetical protein